MRIPLSESEIGNYSRGKVQMNHGIKVYFTPWFHPQFNPNNPTITWQEFKSKAVAPVYSFARVKTTMHKATRQEILEHGSDFQKRFLWVLEKWGQSFKIKT